MSVKRPHTSMQRKPNESKFHRSFDTHDLHASTRWSPPVLGTKVLEHTPSRPARQLATKTALSPPSFLLCFFLPPLLSVVGDRCLTAYVSQVYHRNLQKLDSSFQKFFWVTSYIEYSDISKVCKVLLKNELDLRLKGKTGACVIPNEEVVHVSKYCDALSLVFNVSQRNGGGHTLSQVSCSRSHCSWCKSSVR